MVLDGILGRDHDERLGKRMRRVIHTGLRFVHRFQQRRLCLRGTAIDLVRENYVSEERTRLELELRARRVENRDSDDVRGQQITRELDAPKRSGHGSGQGLTEHRLSYARYVLDQ